MKNWLLTIQAAIFLHSDYRAPPKPTFENIKERAFINQIVWC